MKSETDIDLRQISQDDLPQVAQVHTNSFPNSALTRLGAEVVSRYYLWQLTGPHEKVRAVGAFIQGNCVGFSFSGVFNDSTTGFVNQNKGVLIAKTILHPSLLLNSLFRHRVQSGLKLLRIFTKRKHSDVGVRSNGRRNSYGILAIAVSTGHQKLGIGKMLMNDAELEATRSGFNSMHLTVDPCNYKAIRFYENQKWVKSLKGNQWTGSMVKSLTESEQ